MNMKIRTTEKTRYDVIVFESFTYRGKTRNKPHTVGTALPSV